ncbi:DUF3078 domain-containing protein [Salegentibacter sp. F188]|uniref:DUF3078 domain-containing protein n=1 Tax=Autumnicola patrickiae TaxID=3075591 RepID=A0ABU3E4I3_9FLAO|nr:DUF3078 domain-containing protein [Salegentibacter sp. F188]MDT0690842.1 DUF3078 domain-containing protein [Salegentibacter sp. F188]
MKIRLLSLILCLYSISSFSSNFYQIPVIIIDTTEAERNSIVQDSVETDVVNYWDEKNAVGLDFSEVAFINWSSGGNNSVSALIHGDFERNYKKELTNWRNSAIIRYGINAQEGREIRKTEDELVISSSFGSRRDSTSNWYYSAKMDFNTQFTNGYRYPDTENPISKFMAPGYLFLGVGAEFSHPNEDLTAYFSPITQKSTFVLDQRLANEGMFGVTPAVRDEDGNLIEKGEKVRTEFGMLLTSKFSKEIFENVNLRNRLSLYSDYLNKFGNIDVDWQVNVNLKVNDFIKANVGSQIRYDDDVKYKEDIDGDGELETTGPRIQFKQTLGIGVVYEF